MLVLTRKRGEEIELTAPPSHFGRRIVVKVIEAGNEVRLGIDADKEVLVRRLDSHARMAEDAKSSVDKQ